MFAKKYFTSKRFTSCVKKGKLKNLMKCFCHLPNLDPSKKYPQSSERPLHLFPAKKSKRKRNANCMDVIYHLNWIARFSAENRMPEVTMSQGFLLGK